MTIIKFRPTVFVTLGLGAIYLNYINAHLQPQKKLTFPLRLSIANMKNLLNENFILFAMLFHSVIPTN